MYNFHLVAFGSSAGGLQPLIGILSQLPADFPAAVIVVSHLLANRESKLDLLLSRKTNLPVERATDGQQVNAGTIYVLPSGKLMTLKEGILQLQDRPKDYKVNLAIDYFFTSLAEDAGDKAIGVILSGAGFDGVEGARVIEERNGLVIVQEPYTAQFPLMPANLIANDHPDYILTPDEIARKLKDKIL